jgi:hypothetical protein
LEFYRRLQVSVQSFIYEGIEYHIKRATQLRDNLISLVTTEGQYFLMEYHFDVQQWVVRVATLPQEKSNV